jgi:CheY-like chemotaxis protein
MTDAMPRVIVLDLMMPVMDGWAARIHAGIEFSRIFPS